MGDAVMHGLDPCIQGRRPRDSQRGRRLDARLEAGHDERRRSRRKNGRERGVKITGVRTLVVNAQMRNWVFVRVETDQPGLYGWGEATLEWKTRAVVGAVQDLEP